MSANVDIPRFRYYAQKVTIASGVQDQITFRESSGVDLIATIAAGTYTWGELAYQAKVALDAAGASVYTVRYRYANRTFTITSDGAGGGGLLQLIGGGARNALPNRFGFNSTATGALTYTSDTAVPSQTTLDASRPLRLARARTRALRDELILESGRTEQTRFGQTDEYQFVLDFETRSVAQGFYDLVSQAGAFGGVIELYPDKDESDYLEVLLTDDSWDIEEMTAEGVYGLYRLQCRFRVAVPNAGGLTLRDLIDRRPL